MPLHEQHRPDFIFMDINAPAHRGSIIRERLLEAGVRESNRKLWDQLNRRAEGRNPAPQNLSDPRAVLQEEWDAMPQQTISRFVKSMRHHGHAVTDAQA